MSVLVIQPIATYNPHLTDLLGSGNKIANLTLYDVKSLYRQAKNYALNISEIEAKVDEATNDDPW